MAYADFRLEHNRHQRLRFALLLAAALHIAFILGLGFKAAPMPPYTPPLEVTLATRASAQEPEQAKLRAAVNQLGSGDPSDHEEITSSALSPSIQTQADQIPSLVIPNVEQQHHATPATATAAASQTYITKHAEAKVQLQTPTVGTNPEINQLSRELASLEARLDSQSRAYSTMPRVRRLTSTSTKRAVDAAYLLQWRQIVEAVGNRYYPEASERYSIYGSLRLLVVIHRDGSLEDIKILSSSGHALLDEAAIKIVRLAAPFAPFSAELQATTDKLEIIRTWQFQENRLSSK